MRRRDFVCALGGAVAARPLPATGQQLGRTARIGWLAAGASGRQYVQQANDTFRQALGELGYTEGPNFAIESRFAESDLDRLPQLAAELVQLNVDIIIATPAVAALAARRATDKTPIVMVNVGDPVGLGLVASLARPGGNVTGLAYSVGYETVGKGLEFLKDVIPNLRSVAILANLNNAATPLAIKSIEAAAARLGLKLESTEARGPEDFERAFAAMAERRVEALLILPDVLMLVHAARLSDLALKSKLPSLRAFTFEVEAGGLLFYGPSFFEPWRRAATFVDKLLKGANAAELPVEQPTKFELVINLKTAKALGLTIPPTLLARADEVIE